MGREESKTPLLENYANGSSPNDSASASSAFPSGQVPPADDVPPPYTDTPPSTAFLNYHHHHPEPSPSREALLSRDKYGILSAKTQKDPSGSKTTVISRSLSSDPDLLGEFISAQARLMPNPLVRLLGTHTETHERRNSERTTTVTDFDLSISLADLLTPVWRRTKLVENGMKAYRGERRKTVATGYKSDPESTDTAPRLEEWYHRFCASPAGVKTFTLSHRITNRDDSYLKEALHGVLRSTNYRGNISVSFSVEERATVVMSDHPFNRYRTNSCIWWICVLSPLWLITWPILWLMSKRWAVVSVEWPCRIFERPDGGWPKCDEEFPELVHEGISVAGQDTRGASRARVAVMSEAAWVEGWRAAIMRAAESRTQGTLYASDRDATNAIEERNAERDLEARQRTRIALLGSFADATMGLFRGASETWRNVRMSGGWGGNT